MQNYNADNSFIGNQLSQNDTIESDNPNFDFVKIQQPEMLKKQTFLIETDNN